LACSIVSRNYLNYALDSPHSMFKDNNLGVIRVQFLKLLPNSLNIRVVLRGQLHCSHPTSVANSPTQHSTGISKTRHKQRLPTNNSNQTTRSSGCNLRPGAPQLWNKRRESLLGPPERLLNGLRCHNTIMWLGQYRCSTNTTSKTTTTYKWLLKNLNTQQSSTFHIDT